MQVTINTLSGSECSLKLPTKATVWDAKLAAQVAFGVPRREQRLIEGSRIVRDEETLDSLTDGDHLCLSLVRVDPKRPELLEGISSGVLLLQDLSEELRGDREVVLAAVCVGGWSLEFASYPLRSDREVALAAVECDPLALEHVAESLKHDRQTVLAAVRRNGWALSFASSDLRNDEEIVLSAVSSNPLALQFASSALRSNRNIVKEAVRRKAMTLSFAAKDLQSDPELQLLAKHIPSVGIVGNVARGAGVVKVNQSQKLAGNGYHDAGGDTAAPATASAAAAATNGGVSLSRSRSEAATSLLRKKVSSFLGFATCKARKVFSVIKSGSFLKQARERMSKVAKKR
eukprot:TRINITY_DN5254_c9_g1_i1.p1 TRINITY_DN5254_c9_g1~~TRINITY_DN5254_c9_g1_i1.p1  ORF type:complete len:345 (-),score=80.64 TRINITY_DN5254_c9_g1_i1:144-1178(-)